MGAGVSVVVRGSWDEGVVVSLPDIVLIEECCVYRRQGFEGDGALLIRSLRCEWLSVMPGIMPIDYWVRLHKGSGCQGFDVSRSC
jgi:hypothetical protein